MVYIPTRNDLDGHSLKVNVDEAQWIVRIVQRILNAYQELGRVPGKSTIGIITPFRAQIACINQLLNTIESEWVELISVDTVERYQGSARDIIVFSTVVNTDFQLDSLVSLSDENIDRKLNVAFTRAREQFILLGNESILSRNPAYKLLIQRSKRPSFNSVVNLHD